MTDSSNLSAPPSPSPASPPNKWPARLIMAIALLGLADAAYLTANHYTGADLSCSLTGGCQKVLGSDYATVQGVPISLFGVLYYAGMFLGAYYHHLTGDDRFRRAYTGLVASATVVTAYLLYLQFFVIRAICQYCMVSAIATFSMAALAAWAHLAARRGRGQADPA